MPFADKYIELARRGRELRKQVDAIRAKCRQSKTRDDLKTFKKALRRYNRHLREVQRAKIESAQESHNKAITEAKKEAGENKASTRSTPKRVEAQRKSFK